MKRHHRLWHRRIWWALVPTWLPLMAALVSARSPPPSNAPLPQALVNVAEGDP